MRLSYKMAEVRLKNVDVRNFTGVINAIGYEMKEIDMLTYASIGSHTVVAL